MNRANNFLIIITIFIMSAILLSTCKMAQVIGKPLNNMQLVDGVYDGNYKSGPNKVEVKVTIKNNKIENIEIVKHTAGKGKKAEMPVISSIIEKQSAKVDAVTGATNSSRVIMNAVQKAIEKACKN
ncbi:MAG: FMN-binding protein [Bacteroidia bacterium]|nr:FMN-binding protein [Bacteroidia bacterium]